jgi:hypothetical protein
LLALLLPRWIIDRRSQQLVGSSHPSGLFEVKDRLAAETEMRSTAFQAITALILIVGAAVTIFQLSDTERATSSEIGLTKDSQEGAQFTQAVGQLATKGARNLPARVGAVYALTQLGVSSHAYRPITLDIFTTFVKETAPRTGAKQSSPAGPLIGRDPALQSALTAIGGKLYDPAARSVVGLSIDVSDVPEPYLGDATFASGHFAKADFAFDGLDGSNFTKTDLRGACFFGASTDRTDFSGADLRGANLRRVENLNAAVFDAHTRYDLGTKWPKRGDLARPLLAKILAKIHKGTNSSLKPIPCSF